MKTIVWDVDDVLNNLMWDWFNEAWLPTHPDCLLRYEDIRENPPHRLLGVSKEVYLTSLDAFREERGSALLPNPEVLRWFEKNGHAFHHAVLTAVPLKHAGISASWVYKHFGRWVHSFNVVPSPRPEDPEGIRFRQKGEYLAWWGRASLLVDDSPSNLDAARKAGIPCAAFPRPWNEEACARDLAEAFRIDFSQSRKDTPP